MAINRKHPDLSDVEGYMRYDAEPESRLIQDAPEPEETLLSQRSEERKEARTESQSPLGGPRPVQSARLGMQTQTDFQTARSPSEAAEQGQSGTISNLLGVGRSSEEQPEAAADEQQEEKKPDLITLEQIPDLESIIRSVIFDTVPDIFLYPIDTGAGEYVFVTSGTNSFPSLATKAVRANARWDDVNLGYSIVGNVATITAGNLWFGIEDRIQIASANKTISVNNTWIWVQHTLGSSAATVESGTTIPVDTISVLKWPLSLWNFADNVATIAELCWVGDIKIPGVRVG